MSSDTSFWVFFGYKDSLISLRMVKGGIQSKGSTNLIYLLLISLIHRDTVCVGEGILSTAH